MRDIYVGEEPLDVNRTYTLASHNYWLKSGGDGMSMLMGCPILKDETMVDVDTITSYISEYCLLYTSYGSQRAAIRLIEETGFSPWEKAAILGENARKILKDSIRKR